MPIQIGEKPLPSFATPLALLTDCHRRIEHFLDALLLVAGQARGGPLSPGQREAWENALRYFREGAPKHTQDEEDSLFPRLREVEDERARAALCRIAALEAGHREAQAAHTVVEQLGQRWLAENALTEDACNTLCQTLAGLRQFYRGHIRLEDEEIFPLAAQVLDEAALQAIGQEMAARRRTARAADAG